MAKNKVVEAPAFDPDQDKDEELTPEQMRAQLKKLRSRVTAMESVGKGSQHGLTHPHDIERLHRLGLLPPEDVARFQATGQLPSSGAVAANVIEVAAPEGAKA